MSPRARDAFVIFGSVVPIYGAIYVIAGQAKALVGTTVIMSLGIAIQGRKEGWATPSFWLIVAVVVFINSAAFVALPVMELPKPSLAIAYPLAIVEGLGVYWLLGWWLRARR